MQQAQPAVGILGLGTCVPERVMTNADFEKIVETSDEWIVTRTGIRERRFAAENETTSDLATGAARAAIADAGLTPADIDLIICCTMSPDTTCPSTACVVQAALGGTPGTPAFDLAAACSGFLYGCTVGASMIQAGVNRRVLVIGAETMSKMLDFTDRGTCVLFGDGAGAVVLGEAQPGRGLLGQIMGADGSGAAHIVTPVISRDGVENGEKDPTRYLSMNGSDVYKFATRICGQAIEDAVRATGNGMQVEDLELIVPHQANVRIIDAAANRLGIPRERFVVNIERYGNTSAATIPLALADARADGRLKPGTLVAMVAFGGGLTYAASVWRW